MKTKSLVIFGCFFLECCFAFAEEGKEHKSWRTWSKDLRSASPTWGRLPTEVLAELLGEDATVVRIGIPMSEWSECTLTFTFTPMETRMGCKLIRSTGRSLAGRLQLFQVENPAEILEIVDDLLPKIPTVDSTEELEIKEGTMLIEICRSGKCHRYIGDTGVESVFGLRALRYWFERIGFDHSKEDSRWRWDDPPPGELEISPKGVLKRY